MSKNNKQQDRRAWLDYGLELRGIVNVSPRLTTKTPIPFPVKISSNVRTLPEIVVPDNKVYSYQELYKLKDKINQDIDKLEKNEKKFSKQYIHGWREGMMKFLLIQEERTREIYGK